MADQRLRVVIFVRRFAPDKGGIETTAEVLARGFAERHNADVTVVTRTVEQADDEAYPFAVVREPSPRDLLRVVRRSDVVLHNNPLMRFAWATWLSNKPTVVAIRQYVFVPGRKEPMWYRALLHAKFMAMEDADELIGNSTAMKEHLPSISEVIPNSYRDQFFRVMKNERPRQTLIYLGRLGKEKAPDLPVEAVAALVERGFGPTLTIVGPGTDEELDYLRKLVADLGLTSRVTLEGAVGPEEANRLLNEHAIAIVPSRVPESFGTVALEAAASGCVVVGSGEGGLVQAIGPCGPLFTPRDDADLARVLEELFTNDELFQRYRGALAGHVGRHVEHVMVDRYFEVVARVARGEGKNATARTFRGRLRRLLHHGPPGWR